MVSSASLTETFKRKLASLPASPRDQSQTRTPSQNGSTLLRRNQASSSHHSASSSAFQDLMLGTSCSGFTRAQNSSQHGASTIFTRGQEFGYIPRTSNVIEQKHIHQVPSSALPATDSLCSNNKSWQNKGSQEKQQASYNLSHVPNWSSALQRSLPPTKLPRCHDNAEYWPKPGNNRSQREGVEKRCNENLALNPRVRPKPQFRPFYTMSSHLRHEDLQQGLLREENPTHGIKPVRKEVRDEAKLMMVNRDFTVTSPVRENLLVTIALMTQGNTSTEDEEVELAVKEPLKPVQIMIGKFTAFSSYLRFKLCRDALRVKFEQNAGGSSTISESLSVEYFARRFQAQDVVTEMEVEYWSSNWKKVDYICTLYGQRVGVSVTRAMCYPDPNAFSTEIAYRLLYKKLYGLVVARDGVSKRHSFCKCILHAWCETQRTAEIMKAMYAGVREDLEISDDVIMVLTVADGLHTRPIFYEHALANN